MVNTGFPRVQKSQKARLFLACFVLMIAGIVVLFITAPTSNRQKAADDAKNSELKQKLADELNKDSDNDGLKDWEEALYGTDPHNPDTSGDGMTDGEKIREGRDPLKKGPNNQLTVPLKPVEQPLVFNQDNSTHTLTQRIFQDPTIQGILAKQGGQISPDLIANYLKNLPVDSVIGQPSSIDTQSLHIINDVSPLAIQTYFDALVNIYIKQKDAFLQGDDLTIVNDALNKNDPIGLQKLDSIMNALDTIIKDANALPIPASILWFHQKDMDLLLETKSELRILKNAFDDPIGALSVVQKRLETKQAITSLYQQDLKDWLLKNNLTLSSNAQLFFLQ